MRVVNLGTVNALATRTPTIDLYPGRHMSTAKRFKNAVCILRSGGNPYVKITIKDGSTAYRGVKGNDLSFHAVYNSNRTLMETHDRKSNSDRFGPRLNSGSGKDSIQDLVDKANGNAVWNVHFVFAVLRQGDDIVFDADFDGPGTKFRGGRGR